MELLEKNPAPDKETDVMAWVGYRNMLKAQEMMVVLEEEIYSL